MNFIKNLTTDQVNVYTQKYWYHLDHLNSTKAVTKEDGSVDCIYEYRAFGEELKKLGDGDAKYTYGGKELDGQTNLYYFNARYYDATIGRFINVDPVQDGMNWYVYCNDNPLSFVDITGLNETKNTALDQFALLNNNIQNVRNDLDKASFSNTWFNNGLGLGTSTGFGLALSSTGVGMVVGVAAYALFSIFDRKLANYNNMLDGLQKDIDNYKSKLLEKKMDLTNYTMDVSISSSIDENDNWYYALNIKLTNNDNQEDIIYNDIKINDDIIYESEMMTGTDVLFNNDQNFITNGVNEEKDRIQEE